MTKVVELTITAVVLLPEISNYLGVLISQTTNKINLCLKCSKVLVCKRFYLNSTLLIKSPS